MAEVSYTVKEILQQMDARADERHADLVRRIESGGNDHRALVARVEVLEQRQAENRGGVQARASIITATLIALGVIINIPVAAFYLTGGHG